ncbi:hypothetical protein KBB25_00190 [Candidatus Gracilibacteria bacterium]|nr:hypothetical protein [Candidatus Gracilibacteria bacterium]
MIISSLTSDKKGFSILIALGTTGVLLILVIGLASLYLNEMKLSRLQYDNIFTYSQAEGAFEYAMLKVKNHQDGFQDAMNSSDPDGQMFLGGTDRTKGVTTQYEIDAQTREYTGTLDSGKSIIIPLFVGSGNIIGTQKSREPNYPGSVEQVKDITLNSIDPSTLSWSIIAMSGSESVGITGTGLIDGTEVATMRLRGVDCYDISGMKDLSPNPGSCINPAFQAEELEYFFDIQGKVSDFLKSNGSSDFGIPPNSVRMSITSPYLMIFNNSAGSQDIILKSPSSTAFALPTLKITTESRKGDAAQKFEFTENKAKYSEALNFGVYNTSP